MDYFGLDEDVARLDGRLPEAQSGERLALTTELAWYLRQRDTQRALALVRQAQALPESTDPSLCSQRLGARLRLVEAEAAHLSGQLDEALVLSAQARERFTAAGDLLGRGDTHMLEAAIGQDQGRSERRVQAYEQAFAVYRQGDDDVRTHLAQIWTARDLVMVDDQAAQARWGTLLDELTRHGHPGVEACAAEFWGHMHLVRSDYSQAIRQFQRTHERAMAAGAPRLACFALGNMGAAYANLGDVAHAFKVTEQALTLARRTGWPIVVGVSLLQAAFALAERSPSLAQSQAARELLEEAVSVLTPFRQSRIYAGASQVLGEVMQRLGRCEEALAWHEESMQVAQRLRHVLIVLSALRGKALALSQLGRTSQAIVAAEQALELARENRDRHRQFEVLGTLAKIAQAHAMPAPAGANAPSGVIHYLEEALGVARGIDNFTLPSEFLVEVSKAYEAAGHLRLALEFERRAAASRERTTSKEALHLATAMQVRYDTERAKAEAQHQRELAATEAARTAVLETANATLEQLARIGREITATLDADVVCIALHRHVRKMVNADGVEVWLLEADLLTLSAAMPVSVGTRLSLPLADPVSAVARCARLREETFLHALAGEGHHLLMPLVAGGRVLGVLGVQWESGGPLDENGRQVLRSLSAYGAVALSNAMANRALEQRARHDGLTGLANRSHFDVVLAGEIERARRYGKSLSLVLCDVDHFKSFNDRYGHLAGDHCLQQVSAAMRGASRSTDTPARYGGEEFALVLPETGRSEAWSVAERLRLAVAALQIGHEASTAAAHVTISVGVVTYDGDAAATTQELLASADRCLYEAKRGGRNRCVEHGAPSDAAPTSSLRRRRLA